MNKVIMFFLLLVSAGSYASENIEDVNKSIVTSFYTEVLLGRDSEAIDKYIGDKYIQHNPLIPNGKKALKSFIDGSPSATPGEIVRVLADGDLVALHVKRFSKGGRNNRVIVDIFRVEDSMIVEHWDVIQAIPEHSINGNSMF
ncbi:nuclear transport factor 2 family protein [Vibrio aestuarianus]|uniref:nuclear transport factor 2 family protein n=1 Tax=Vibrio aestuarianus TaxID=28171 RepID=UPI00237D0B5A|nr:nuclear transport factor 2 family protein [Vibrio aestuarianus]MDE1351340.1 nuclear transport factor 2 family protein [Vibrio aestuarianus]